jgi:preprotein translocase subunit SecG
MKIFLTIIFLLVCIGLTAIVLMQEGKSAGLGSIGGIGDSYWGKNKSRSMEGNLVKFTKILATAFLLIALLLNVIPDASSSSSTTPTTPAAAVETEAVTETQAATSETQAASEAGKAQAESETAKTQAVTEAGGASETEK